MLEITVTNLRRCDLIRVKGRIDSETAGELKEALDGITGAGRYNIVFNMSDVTFISSAGLNQLIDTMKTCTRLRRGKLVLSDLPENIASTLALAGLDEVFSCYSSEAEAVGNF